LSDIELTLRAYGQHAVDAVDADTELSAHFPILDAYQDDLAAAHSEGPRSSTTMPFQLKPGTFEATWSPISSESEEASLRAP
jgi:hypothetical protein